VLPFTQLAPGYGFSHRRGASAASLPGFTPASPSMSPLAGAGAVGSGAGRRTAHGPARGSARGAVRWGARGVNRGVGRGGAGDSSPAGIDDSSATLYNAGGFSATGVRRFPSAPSLSPPSHGLRTAGGSATLQPPPPLGGTRTGLPPPPSRSPVPTVRSPPRRTGSAAAARQAAASRPTASTHPRSNAIKKTTPKRSTNGGSARKSPPTKKPPTPLEKAVAEAVKVGIWTGLQRMEDKASALSGALDTITDKMDNNGQGYNTAITSMAQFETALNNGNEKVIKSVGSASAAPPAAKRSPIDHCCAMASLPLKERLEIALLNKQQMESVRCLYEVALNETMGGATLTRESYVDTLAAWDLMCSTAGSQDKLSDKKAESYMLSARLFPTSDGMSVKLATVPSWFTNSVPRLMEKYRKVMVSAFFDSVEEASRTSKEAAQDWLERFSYRTSPRGKTAIKCAIEAFLEFAGFHERIVAPSFRGGEGHVECVLGHVSLACAAVRWHLEVGAAVRAAGHKGNSQTFHAVSRDETSAIDLDHPLHDKVHEGIRLIDGKDVRRTHTFSEEVVGDTVLLAAAGRGTGQGADAANTIGGGSAPPAGGDAPDGSDGHDGDALVAAATTELTIDVRDGGVSDMSADGGEILGHQRCDDVDKGNVGGGGDALGGDGSQRSGKFRVRLAGDSGSDSSY